MMRASFPLLCPAEYPAPASCIPFLQALERVEHGTLAMRTPEGIWLYFGGAPGPRATMLLHEWEALEHGLARGETGFADAYIAKQWDTGDLPGLLTFALLNTHCLERFFHGHPLYALWMKLSGWLQSNSMGTSRRNVLAHYDVGNEFYRLWLDKSMTYSCALFEGDTSRTLEKAQQAKYQRILQKLNVMAGDHILEIGCGWGAFAEAAAREGARVTAITLSPEQSSYAAERLRNARLDHLAQIELQDYRQVRGQFDHIVSIGMFEHVGERHWLAYFKAVNRCLKPGGKAMIQTITLDDAMFEKLRHVRGFIEEYIFPGGIAPSRARFCAAARKAGLECKETFAFGSDYALTLSHWLRRFEAHLPEISLQGFDERFIRLWRFYLASCIASFVSQRSGVMQAELQKAPPR